MAVYLCIRPATHLMGVSRRLSRTVGRKPRCTLLDTLSLLAACASTVPCGALDGRPAQAAARRSHPAKRLEHLVNDMHFIGDAVVGLVGRVVGEAAERRRLPAQHWLDALDHEPTSVPDHEALAGNGIALVRVVLSNIWHGSARVACGSQTPRSNHARC